MTKEVDLLGRPLSDIIWTPGITILPEHSLEERKTSTGLKKTRYAVFRYNRDGYHRISRWYCNYGNAIRYIRKIERKRK